MQKDPRASCRVVVECSKGDGRQRCNLLLPQPEAAEHHHQGPTEVAKLDHYFFPHDG